MQRPVFLSFKTNLVEDVIAALGFQLEDDTRLLEQVRLNITARKFAAGAEMNSNELTLKVYIFIITN